MKEQPTSRPQRSRTRRLAIAATTALVAAGALFGLACSDNGTSPAPTQAPQTSQPTAQVPVATPPPDPDLDDIPRTTSRNVTLTGAGATFPNVLYSHWSDEYNALNRSIRVNYQSVGSGAGIRQVIEKTVDFGGTDGPMNAEQKASAGSTVWHIPMAMGAVVPAYNLPGDPQLQLRQATIADIFLGKITKWNDPAIVADNPGIDLPDSDIAVVHRSDGSGTTFIWVDFLSNISNEWRDSVGVGTSVNWPTGIGANGNEGVANQIRQIPGAIGYVELAYAEQNNLPSARLENREGRFIAPNYDSVSAAAAGMIAAGQFPADMEARVTNAPGADSWPASGFTWVLLYEELNVLPTMTQERAEELIRYVLWSLDADGGQQWNVPLHYAPLDPIVQEFAREALKNITFNGTPVWQSMQP